MRGMLWMGVAAVTALAVAPGTALAGGFEFPGAGARPMGRGGAMIARADSPLTLLYDPAGLAELGTSQIELDASIGFLGACMRRSGNGVSHFNNPGIDQTRFFTVTDTGGPMMSPLNDPYPEVCNEGPPGPGGELIGTVKIGDRLGLGFGLLTPLAVGHLIYGDGEGGTADRRLPSPVRYQLVEEQIILAYPTIGAGYRVTDWLRLGASFGWGIGIFKFVNDTVANSGENPEQDILSNLTASDFFIPQINVSAHFVPIDALDLVLGFRWTDDVSASGDADLTYGHFGSGSPEGTILTTTSYSNVGLAAPQPWQLYFGARFADRITPRPRDARAIERLSRRVEDSMSNERWDVELDVVYELNSRVDDLVVTFPEGRPGLANAEFDAGMELMNSPIIIPPVVTVPHRWKDQLSLRLGGDYNVIPGLAAVRLGASFETRGVSSDYAGIDFFPMMRFGIHAGLTVRIGRTDISLSYAHFFHESLTVSPGSSYDMCTVASAPGAARGRQVSATGTIPGEEVAGCVVNAGTITSNMNAIALSGNYHF